MKERAIIVGSGIAGLASSIRLRKMGYEVTVFEAAPHAGGKLHAFRKNGFRFDYGPSLFTMPHLVEELFQLMGEDPEETFPYMRKDTVCHYFWEDGTRFQVHADMEDFIADAVDVFDVTGDALRNYLGRNKIKYDHTAPVFLEKSLHKTATWLSADTLKAASRIFSFDILRTLNEVNRQHFKDPRLVQLFNRYATYNGSSPFRTPGIMSMIPHLEMHYGTYLPRGGMHEISRSLYRLAERHGVQFRFSTPVQRILHENGRATGVSTSGGASLADIVISNMDIYATYNRLLTDIPRPEKTLAQERSSSAVIFYWGIAGEFHELDLHNIFFTDNYREEFACIFEKGEIFHDPTIYVNITAKDIPADAPPGCENWFVMINAPGNTGQDWEKMTAELRTHALSKLRRILDRDIEPLIKTETVLDPIGIEADTSSHQGSLYGTASNSRFSAFLRHPNFSGKLQNLYFCGGSVHPGGGIPLCLLSARITADLIANER